MMKDQQKFWRNWWLLKWETDYIKQFDPYRRIFIGFRYGWLEELAELYNQTLNDNKKLDDIFWETLLNESKN